MTPEFLAPTQPQGNSFFSSSARSDGDKAGTRSRPMNVSTPPFTQHPHTIFDRLRSSLLSNEYKVFDYVWRLTVGWRRIKAEVSNSQIERACSISKHTLLKALDALRRKHVIRDFPSGRRNVRIVGPAAELLPPDLREISFGSETALVTSAKVASVTSAEITPPVLKKEEQKEETMTTKNGESALLCLLDGLQAIGAMFNEHTAVQLWESCKNLRADCLAEDVLEAARKKLPLCRERNRLVGFLLKAVPEEIEGSGLERLRAACGVHETQQGNQSEAPKRPEARWFVLPEWMPRESWEGFEEMRERIGKPLTDRARFLTVQQLEKLRSEGEDPRACLDQSTQRSWSGVFPVKSDYQQGGCYGTRGERLVRGNLEAYRQAQSFYAARRHSEDSDPDCHQSR